MNGIVKEYNKQKGFGFISGDDGEDYFKNIANLRKGQRMRLRIRVKYDNTQTTFKASGSADIKSHEFSFGFEFEQRDDSYWGMGWSEYMLGLSLIHI